MAGAVPATSPLLDKTGITAKSFGVRPTVTTTYSVVCVNILGATSPPAYVTVVVK